MDESFETMTEMAQPVIIDLGSQKPGKFKGLKKGKGKLWDEVLDVVKEVKDMLGEGAEGKVIIPVVLIYRKKPKRRRLDNMIFPNLRRLR